MTAEEYQQIQDNMQKSSYLALGAKSIGNIHDPNNPLSSGTKVAPNDAENNMINFTSSNPAEKMMAKKMGLVSEGIEVSNELL